METIWESINKTCSTLGIKPTDRILVVSIAASTLRFYRNQAIVKAYAISTSRRPPSNVKDSLGTPRGLHAIADRIGAGQPPGMVFKGRVSTGHHYSELPEHQTDSNLITSRILRLRGMEPTINQGGDVDSYARYIYIHGTNHEDRIGKPASAGCILMRNLDIIELYDGVRTGDLVLIAD